MNTRKSIHDFAAFKSKSKINLKIDELNEILKIHEYYKNVSFWKPAKTLKTKSEREKDETINIKLGKIKINYKYKYFEDTACHFEDELIINGEKTNFRVIKTMIDQLHKEEGVFKFMNKKNNNQEEIINVLLDYIDKEKYQELYNCTKQYNDLNFELYTRLVENNLIKNKREDD